MKTVKTVKTVKRTLVALTVFAVMVQATVAAINWRLTMPTST